MEVNDKAAGCVANDNYIAQCLDLESIVQTKNHSVGCESVDVRS